MSRETVTRTISGLKVTSTQLPFTRSAPLMTRLGHILAAVLNAETGKVSLDSDVEALGAVLASLDPATIIPLMLDTLQCTEVIRDGKRIELTTTDALDEALSGDMKFAMHVMAFVLEVNYGAFFDGGLSVTETSAPDLNEKKTNSPSDSTQTQTSPNAG